MNNDLVIGVDIGGTRTKMGLVNLATGEVIHNLVQPTEKKEAAIFLKQIGLAIHVFKKIAKQQSDTLLGIGIGIPGFTSEGGIVDTTYGFLEFMELYPIASIIEKEFGLPCIIDNDARVVSLGEALYGKGKGYSRVLTLTLGTGVGFGLVVDGGFTEPLPLAHMGGHMSIIENGDPCYCGKRGCLEALVSSTGILNAAKEIDGIERPLSAEAVFTAAASGNAAANRITEKVAMYLHIAIHNYINLFAPDMIVLGGGISQGLKPYLQKIKGDSYLSPFPDYCFDLSVSVLQEEAGILGSAALFHSLKRAYA